VKKRRERIDRGIKARSEDVYALSSWREMLYLAGPRLLPAAVFLLLPLFLGVYWQKVMISVAVFALLAISWNILAQTGMISLGQALFFGMGAYVSGVLNFYFGIPPWLAIPAATNSARMLAPRKTACSMFSRTSTAAPSPTTKPERSASNGRQAVAGSSNPRASTPSR
jgi:hypothetical protein